jgi:hypothetical protein
MNQSGFAVLGFFGVIDARLNRLCKDTPLMFSTLVDDGLLPGGQDRSVGGGLGKMLYLVEKRRVVSKQRFEVIVDLERDRLP